MSHKQRVARREAKWLGYGGGRVAPVPKIGGRPRDEVAREQIRSFIDTQLVTNEYFVKAELLNQFNEGYVNDVIHALLDEGKIEAHGATTMRCFTRPGIEPPTREALQRRLASRNKARAFDPNVTLRVPITQPEPAKPPPATGSFRRAVEQDMQAAQDAAGRTNAQRTESLIAETERLGAPPDPTALLALINDKADREFREVTASMAAEAGGDARWEIINQPMPIITPAPAPFREEYLSLLFKLVERVEVAERSEILDRIEKLL